MLLLACVLLRPAVFALATLNGAGATFPHPFDSKRFCEYHKTHSDSQINYQSMNSGGGISAVVPLSNGPGVSGEVQFNPHVLAGMFGGRITNWNDRAISAVNPDPATSKILPDFLDWMVAKRPVDDNRVRLCAAAGKR